MIVRTNDNAPNAIRSPTNPPSPATMRFRTAWDSSLPSKTSPRIAIKSRILTRVCRDAQMPPHDPLQQVENRLGEIAEIPDLDVSISNIIRNFLGEDMPDRDFVDLETRADEAWNLPSRVRICDWTAGLRFGMPSNRLVQLPKRPPAERRNDPENLPREPMINHQLQDATSPHIITLYLIHDPLWVRCVMDYSERID